MASGTTGEGIPGAEWIFCNGCGRTPSMSSKCKYFVGSCAHVFCEKCFAQSAAKEPIGSGSGVVTFCKLCKKQMTGVSEICKNMHESVRMMFAEPEDITNAVTVEMERVARFQEAQANRFMRQLHDLSKRNEKMQQFCVNVTSKSKELESNLVLCEAQLKKKDAELQALKADRGRVAAIAGGGAITSAGSETVRARKDPEGNRTYCFAKGGSLSGSSSDNSHFITPQQSPLSTTVVNELAQMTCCSASKLPLNSSARFSASALTCKPAAGRQSSVILMTPKHQPCLFPNTPKEAAKPSELRSAFETEKSSSASTCGNFREEAQQQKRLMTVTEFATRMQMQNASTLAAPRKRGLAERLFFTAPAKKAPHEHIY